MCVGAYLSNLAISNITQKNRSMGVDKTKPYFALFFTFLLVIVEKYDSILINKYSVPHFQEHFSIN